MDAAKTKLLGTTIREARVKQGMTGEDVRDACGIDPTSLSMWERGVRIPPLARIPRLAMVLGLDPVELATLALEAVARREGRGRRVAGGSRHPGRKQSFMPGASRGSR
jgi:transcriptional regulator with XRE-family HTH domain